MRTFSLHLVHIVGNFYFHTFLFSRGRSLKRRPYQGYVRRYYVRSRSKECGSSDSSLSPCLSVKTCQSLDRSHPPLDLPPWSDTPSVDNKCRFSNKFCKACSLVKRDRVCKKWLYERLRRMKSNFRDVTPDRVPDDREGNGNHGHFREFDPNCCRCLSDDMHVEVLSKYVRRYKDDEIDVQKRGRWWAVKKCGPHRSEYCASCRKCRQYGRRVKRPNWWYQQSPTSSRERNPLCIVPTKKVKVYRKRMKKSHFCESSSSDYDSVTSIEHSPLHSSSSSTNSCSSYKESCSIYSSSRSRSRSPYYRRSSRYSPDDYGGRSRYRSRSPMSRRKRHIGTRVCI